MSAAPACRLQLTHVVTHHPSRVAFREFLHGQPGGVSYLLDFYLEAQVFHEVDPRAPPEDCQQRVQPLLAHYTSCGCAPLATLLKRTGVVKAARTTKKCGPRMLAAAQEAAMKDLYGIFEGAFVGSDRYNTLVSNLALRLALHSGLNTDFTTGDSQSGGGGARHSSRSGGPAPHRRHLGSISVSVAAAGSTARSCLAAAVGTNGCGVTAVTVHGRPTAAAAASRAVGAGARHVDEDGVRSNVRHADPALAGDVVSRRARSLSNASAQPASPASAAAGGSSMLLPPGSAVGTAASAAARPCAPPQLAFRDLLYNPLGIEIFYDYMRLEHNDENLLFHMCARRFRRRVHVSAEAQRDEARAIRDRFLCATSPDEVNISSAARRKAATAVERDTVARTVFDHVSVAVTRVIRADIYTRFLLSRSHASRLDELRRVVLAASHDATVDRRAAMRQVAGARGVDAGSAGGAGVGVAGASAGGGAGPTAARARGPRASDRRWNMKRAGSDSDVVAAAAGPARAHDQTLAGTLADEHLLRLFIESSAGEFSEELPLFWCAADEYRMGWARHDDIANLMALARAIFRRYVEGGAEYEVPCDARERERIAAAVRTHQSDASTFAALQASIFTLMEMSTHPRFLRGDAYAQAEATRPAPAVPRALAGLRGVGAGKDRGEAPAHLYPTGAGKA